jgi:hypothetical protein
MPYYQLLRLEAAHHRTSIGIHHPGDLRWRAMALGKKLEKVELEILEWKTDLLALRA